MVNGLSAVVLAPLAKAYWWAALPTHILLPIYFFTMINGAKEEGVRMLQVSHYFGLAAFLVGSLFGASSATLAGLWIPFFAIYIQKWYQYGVSPYSNFKSNGPYKVGAKDYYTSTGGHVVVYYPIDVEEYDSKIEDQSFAKYRYSNDPWDKTKERFVESATKLFDGKGKAVLMMPEDLNQNIRLDAVENATISKDFGSEEGKLKLRPMIYSHGNKGLPAGYASVLSDYASRGMVVFAPAHTDQSCRYTELQDGTPIMGE